MPKRAPSPVVCNNKSKAPKSSRTLSSVERCIPTFTVASFLTIKNLWMLISCSSHLREKYIPAFAPRVWWRGSAVRSNKFCSEFLPFVHKIVVDDPGRIPQVTEIKCFNTRAMRVPALPTTLTSLTLPMTWNKQLKPGELPSSLTELNFGFNFDKPLNHALPSLLTLRFGMAFNTPVFGELPPSLTRLHFGSYFNQPLALPSGVTELVLGCDFAQPAANICWPSRLTKLTVPEHTLHQGLPSTVRDLSLKDLTDLCPGSLPSSLTRLSLSTAQDVGFEITDGLPESLTELVASGQPIAPGTLPAGLTSLEEFWFTDVLAPNVLPSGLKYLTVFDSCDGVLTPGALPAGLTSFSLGGGQLQPGALPAALTEFKLGTSFSSTLCDGALPPNLTRLIFGHCFNEPIKPGVLPSKLLDLGFGDAFNQPLEGVLPPELTKLRLGKRFNQSLSRADLPSTLTCLHLPHSSSADLAELLRYTEEADEGDECEGDECEGDECEDALDEGDDEEDEER